MATYNWYATASSCPDAVNPKPGWYSGTTFITSTYRNPSTGMAYTPQELQALAGGGGVVTGDTGGSTIPTTSQLEATTQGGGLPSDSSYGGGGNLPSDSSYGGGALPSGGPQYPTTPPTTSTLENLQVPQAPTLPPYKPTAELEKLSSQVGGAISGIIEQGGIGMGEDTKEQIFLREAEIINANTAQANKNLEDKMAAQGLSDSGMAFSESMKLASKNSIAMANVMRDVEIQDALMKVASYQNALGLGVQFLSYLSEESWRQYQPTLYQWQAQVEMYKMAISQAYTQGNMALAHQYNMELAQFEADTEIQMAEMQLEAANAQAASQGIGNIFGTVLGWLIPGS